MLKQVLLFMLLLSASAFTSCQSKQNNETPLSKAPESSVVDSISSTAEKELGQKAFLWSFYTRLLALEGMPLIEGDDANALDQLLTTCCTPQCLSFLQQKDRDILGEYDGYKQGNGALYFRIGGQDPSFDKQILSLRIEQGNQTDEYKVTMTDYETHTITLSLVPHGDSYQINKVDNPHWK
ncbi:MAG: hypothetical protein Q4D66_00895 [Bacteroidales bacterium]|nr:hypothetical protein [Bacteroidales bacterium]